MTPRCRLAVQREPASHHYHHHQLSCLFLYFMIFAPFMYVYRTVPTVQYHTGAILLLLLFVREREPQTTKQKIPTQHLVLLPIPPFFILTHLFHTAVYASPSPRPPKAASIWNLKKKNHAQHQNHRAPSRQHNSKMHNRTTRSGNASARSGCRGRLHL